MSEQSAVSTSVGNAIPNPGQWIAKLCGGTWGEHPKFPISDWKLEVENDDTRRGYWDWVAARLEEASHPSVIEQIKAECDQLKICFVIRSESEKGFWSNEDGWVESIESATKFETNDGHLPVSAGNDAMWEMTLGM